MDSLSRRAFLTGLGATAAVPIAATMAPVVPALPDLAGVVDYRGRLYPYQRDLIAGLSRLYAKRLAYMHVYGARSYYPMAQAIKYAMRDGPRDAAKADFYTRLAHTLNEVPTSRPTEADLMDALEKGLAYLTANDLAEPQRLPPGHQPGRIPYA